MDKGDDGRDAVTQPFEDVRGELALLRRAIEGIAAARDDRPEPPDYVETLGQTRVANATLQRAEFVRKAIKEEAVARQVANRIAGAVAEDRQAVKTAAGELRDATRALQGVTGSARRGDEQNRWLAVAAIGGIVVGMILWAVFAGIVARRAGKVALARADGGANTRHADVGRRPAHDADGRRAGVRQRHRRGPAGDRQSIRAAGVCEARRSNRKAGAMSDLRRAGAEGRSMMRPIITVLAVSLAVPVMAAGRVQDTIATALDRCLAVPANASTTGQTGCEETAMRSYDQRLNAAYAALMRRLPVPAADRLRRSQRAWLAYRDAEGAARGAIYATRQGTIYVPMEADSAVTLVGDRARTLERYVRVLDIE